MKTVITVLRMAIGWHFLYEGVIKLVAEHWSSESYLSNTRGFLSGFYHWLANSPVRLQIVDYMNIAGLILIGLALFFGWFSRWASLCGALLLALYYFAYPPFGVALLGASEGGVYIVNQLFIETAILIFLFCYKEKGYGVDPLIQYLKKKKQVPVESDEVLSPEGSSRREVLKNLVGLPVLGLLGWSAFRSQKLYGADVMSGATIQVGRTELSALKGKLPIGKIGNQELSRLIMGGNLIGGYSHARDLKYTDTLFKAYNSEKKIFETLMLGEQAGINSINIGYLQMPVMAKYKKLIGSKIKVIVQVGIDDKNKDIYDNVTQAIDLGMDVLQLQGGWGDRLVRDHRVEVVGKMMERIRSEGYVAGLGAHDIETMITCEENGIIPDYYMQTMHHDNYWSAHPRENRKPFETLNGNSKDRNEYHDNLFCPFPERTVEFVNRAKVPVMGFKVLAAGAIKPKEGFNWAFKNGADFICVGMFDFQIVNDVNICLDVLQNLKNRQREWYA